ncbi:MAG: hypothetical protein IJY15_11690 [Thermoguttaceae bacterium]|nr:hypothetical protein [Thermoguttaceae bacterium]
MFCSPIPPILTFPRFRVKIDFEALENDAAGVPTTEPRQKKKAVDFEESPPRLPLPRAPLKVGVGSKNRTIFGANRTKTHHSFYFCNFANINNLRQKSHQKAPIAPL